MPQTANPRPSRARAFRSPADRRRVAALDRRYVWHPFTQMHEWRRREPIVIIAASGALLYDSRGREYLDANSSIWTNLHGHKHPKLDSAIIAQLRAISHSSALGLANEPASLLAEKLVRAAGQGGRRRKAQPRLAKVFFSDDGSTAMEVALKLAYEFARRARGIKRPRFLSLQGAYHGDTVGAASLGHIDLFHRAYSGLLFSSDQVMAPYCYRCPFNRAEPRRADARSYRRCQWECVDKVEARLKARRRQGRPYAAMVVEPLMQGAAGMIPQPSGWLARVAQLVRSHGAQLIADEVMTGFGRTTPAPLVSSEPDLVPDRSGGASLFACHQEGVQPDFLALAKGLTGGYLPMGATLVTQPVFDAFLGDYAEFKTFFHGHSYTGNQLAAAAAGASMDLLLGSASLEARRALAAHLRDALVELWALPFVGDIRQVGCIVGVELVRDWQTRAPFALADRAGIRVCEAMSRRGVLTRPIGNVVVLMPPYCATKNQVNRVIATLFDAIAEVLGGRRQGSNSI